MANTWPNINFDNQQTTLPVVVVVCYVCGGLGLLGA